MRSRPRWLGGLLGLVAVVAGWQLLAMSGLVSSTALPTPVGVVRQVIDDGWSFYWPNIQTTLREAALGYLWGNVLAIVLAVLFVQSRLLERGLLRVAIMTYCLPVIAIGPIFQIVFDGDTPKVILAAMSVFFTTLIGALVGLRSADRTSLELVRAYGGGSWTQMQKVRVRASLPSLFAALKLAAPAALLGAIIGEYLGGESGLGVAMIASEQSLNVERTWGIALVATAVAGFFYALIGLIGARLTTWAPKAPTR
jgi:ABC-type nitrate/sulfonate/bicarbonate transport system permease component